MVGGRWLNILGVKEGSLYSARQNPLIYRSLSYSYFIYAWVRGMIIIIKSYIWGKMLMIGVNYFLMREEGY
jgi:hypothetical protein